MSCAGPSRGVESPDPTPTVSCGAEFSGPGPVGGTPPPAIAPGREIGARSADVLATGATITGLEVVGNRSVPTELVVPILHSRKGEALSPAVVADDIRRLWRLEVFEDVQVHERASDRGVVLVFALRERPLIGRVRIASNDSEQNRWRAPARLPGSPYDPARLLRIAERQQARYAKEGYQQASVRVTHRRRPAARLVDICFTVERGRRFVLQAVSFAGNRALADPLLRAQLETAEGEVNTPGGVYRREWLARDIVRVQALYYERGFLAVEIVPPRLELDPVRGTATPVIEVREGVQYRLGVVEVIGEPATAANRLRSLFAGRSGDVFQRSAVTQWLQDIADMERAAGRQSPSVLPRTELHEERAVVDLWVEVTEAAPEAEGS